MSEAMSVGRRLVELCQRGEFLQAGQELYADDVVSVEAMDCPQFPRETRGKSAVIAKGEAWEQHNEIHGCAVQGPFAHGDDRFAVIFRIDVTPGQGPTAGKREQMEEVAVYTLNAGKILREEFFYALD